MHKLILVRHGESVWNKENKFTGWADPDLSEKGVEEARKAGRQIKEAGIEFDIAFTSVLKRAIRTLHLLEEEADRVWVPEIHNWRLNERHYGALQGLNKAETAEKYGDEQVHIWRRSYNVVPPLMDVNEAYTPAKDPRYEGLDPTVLPLGESLELTVKRVVPFWQDYIAPSILMNKTVLIAAHGNSLRGLVKHLEHINDEDIVALEIPTGIPQVYELDNQLSVIQRYYLE